jgi:trehalose 6-phosphate phosphatase
LTPIVDRPEDAVITPEMKDVVASLSRHCVLGIISGRDLKDVRSMVGLDDIIFAGSHGFDVFRPNAQNLTMRQGEQFLPMLDEAEKEIKLQTISIENCRIERKKFSIAIHYRGVEQGKVSMVEQAVDRVQALFKQLRKNGGKKIFELQPDIDWDKGKALLWLMDKLNLDIGTCQTFYIGDDLTDEDAFKVLQTSGVPILVTEQTDPKTYAHYILRDTDEVKIFLEKLLDTMKG